MNRLSLMAVLGCLSGGTFKLTGIEIILIIVYQQSIS
jgi:hypothetical protein